MKRRNFIRDLGLSPAVLPFLEGLPALASAGRLASRQRLVFVFTPNGTVADEFWPEGIGRHFRLKRILEPLAAYRDRMLLLKGISNRVKGPGNAHVRGIGGLLTGRPLLPGNQAREDKDQAHGWASGISLDQELKSLLQGSPVTRTAFGSLEFGVGVPEQNVPMTRLSYAGPGRPIAPVNSPYEMYRRLYRRRSDVGMLGSVLDAVNEDLKSVARGLDPDGRALLERHATHVRETEKQLGQLAGQDFRYSPPRLAPAIKEENDSLPQISRMQIDLLVNALANDMARVATLQFSKAVGNARMTWLQISDKHHMLSHEPDDNLEAREKLVRINRWFMEQVRHLLDQLAAHPEPGRDGTLLDHTTVVLVNELGKGNTHSLHYLPIVIIGGDMGFRMGRSLRLDWRPRQMDYVPHQRLLLALAHGMGQHLETFGDPELCAGGPMDLNSYTMSELAHDGPAVSCAVAGIGAYAWRRGRKKRRPDHLSPKIGG